MAALTGWTFVDTRPHTPWDHDAKNSILEKRGAEVQPLALLELVALPENSELPGIVQQFSPGDYLVFTSANAIRFAMARIKPEALQDLNIAVIGAKTAAVLGEFGLHPQFVSADTSSAAFGLELARELGTHRDRPSVLLLRGRLAGSALPAALQPAAAQLVDRAIYDAERLILDATAKAKWRVAIGNPKCIIIFTSSETVRAFAELLRELEVSKRTAEAMKLASIGPETSKTIAEYNLPLFLQAGERSFDSLLHDLIRIVESAANIH